MREEQRLLPPEVARAMMLDWLRGVPQAEVCRRYGVTPVQYQRQKYYHKAAVLADVRSDILARRESGQTTDQIAADLGFALAVVNAVAAGTLLARGPEPRRAGPRYTCTVTPRGRVSCRRATSQ